MLPTAIVGQEYHRLSSESRISRHVKPGMELMFRYSSCWAACLDVTKKKSFKLPALGEALPGLSSELSRMLYPDEWQDSDDTANRDKVLKAMQRHTEIILPETYNQLYLNAELQAKHTTAKKTKIPASPAS